MQLSGNGASRKTIPTPKPRKGNLNTEEKYCYQGESVFPNTVGGHAVTLTHFNN